MEKDEGDGMEKGKVDRSHYLFDNKAVSYTHLNKENQIFKSI